MKQPIHPMTPSHEKLIKAISPLHAEPIRPRMINSMRMTKAMRSMDRNEDMFLSNTNTFSPFGINIVLLLCFD